MSVTIPLSTENFFDASKKDKRRQKRLSKKSSRLQKRLETTDAKQGITSEHRKAVKEVELEQKKQELEQDKAVTAIAQALPADELIKPKGNMMLWYVLALLLLIAIAVAVYFLL